MLPCPTGQILQECLVELPVERYFERLRLQIFHQLETIVQLFFKHYKDYDI